MPSPDGVARRVADVRAALAVACERSGRDPAEIHLIAVSKTVPLELVRAAAAAGISEFGENHARELAAKAPAVAATWHFLGKVQRGTARTIAEHATVVHSGEPGTGLEALARRAASAGRTMPALVQIDFTGRRQGVAVEDVERFVATLSVLRGIAVRGLMTIPPRAAVAEAARPYFARLRRLRDRLRERWPELAELSMGMSADYTVAVEEGATMIRVGTALFGERPRAAEA